MKLDWELRIRVGLKRYRRATRPVAGACSLLSRRPEQNTPSASPRQLAVLCSKHLEKRREASCFFDNPLGGPFVSIEGHDTLFCLVRGSWCISLTATARWLAAELPNGNLIPGNTDDFHKTVQHQETSNEELRRLPCAHSIQIGNELGIIAACNHNNVIRLHCLTDGKFTVKSFSIFLRIRVRAGAL